MDLHMPALIQKRVRAIVQDDGAVKIDHHIILYLD